MVPVATALMNWISWLEDPVLIKTGCPTMNPEELFTLMTVSPVVLLVVGIAVAFVVLLKVDIVGEV